jgi:hypothetical protein
MKHLTYSQIKMLQKTYNVERMQQMINDGTCWNMEGSTGRFAMMCLESGACMLPLKPRLDYYGNRIPSRKELKRATKGTFQNSVNFWNRANNGDFDAIEWLEETFGLAEKLAV